MKSGRGKREERDRSQIDFDSSQISTNRTERREGSVQEERATTKFERKRDEKARKSKELLSEGCQKKGEKRRAKRELGMRYRELVHREIERECEGKSVYVERERERSFRRYLVRED